MVTVPATAMRWVGVEGGGEAVERRVPREKI
jgi:hypothetical protein